MKKLTNTLRIDKENWRGWKTKMGCFKGFDCILSCVCLPCEWAWRILGLKPINRSLVTRLVYVLLLALFAVVSVLFLTPTVTAAIFDEKTCKRIGRATCELLRGPAPVYRIFMVVSLFHVVMSFALIGISNSNERRSYIQNHFWTLKIGVLICSASWFIFYPKTAYTGEVWHFFGLNAAFAYVILQFIVLIDIVHSFNTSIVKRIESKKSLAQSVYFYMLLWIPTAALYSLSTAGTIFLFRTYGLRTECRDNTFFIAFHVYMCVSATCISINPVVQEARPKSGLLQSSVATSYSTYVLWITLSNEPDDRCNPTREYLYPSHPLKNIQMLVGLVLAFTILILFCVRKVNPPHYGNSKFSPGLSSHQQASAFDTTRNASQKAQEEQSYLISEDELQGVECSYSFFHATFSLAALYIMMTLTCWYRPEEGEHSSVKLIAGWGAIWIKLCSGIFSVFTYIWILIAPVIFPGAYKDLVFYDLLFVT